MEDAKVAASQQAAGAIARITTLGWPLLCLLLALFLAWRTVAHGMSDIYSIQSPEQALEWESHAPKAQMALAAERLKAGDLPQVRVAIEILAGLLSRDPLAPGALSMFGLGVSLTGDTLRTKIIMSAAAAQNPVDFASHAWLYEDAVKSGDFLTALTEMDLVLRARPAMIETVGPYATLLIRGELKQQEALVAILARAPPWRRDLLRYLAQNTKHTSALLDTFGRLNASEARPTRQEWSMLLERLISDKDFGGAYLGWLASLPLERQNDDLLYNGRFQYEITNLPFDWQITPTNGATLNIVPEGQDTALRVEFFGARVPFHHVRHILFLPQGAYTFSGRQKAEHFRNERGLRWQISCMEKSGYVLGVSPLISDSQTDRAFSTDFTVPATDCVAQELTLAIQARVSDELVAIGTASFWHLSLSVRK